MKKLPQISEAEYEATSTCHLLFDFFFSLLYNIFITYVRFGGLL